MPVQFSGQFQFRVESLQNNRKLEKEKKLKLETRFLVANKKKVNNNNNIEAKLEKEEVASAGPHSWSTRHCHCSNVVIF